MFNTYEIQTLTKLIVQERIEDRQLDRALRAEATKRTVRRRLRRDIETLLKADGSIQSVLDVLDHVAAEAQNPARQRAETTCCP